MRKLIFGLTIPFVMLLGSLWFNENNQNANANDVDFSKEEIHQKMLNSIDYFDTAKGSFRYWITFLDVDYTVDYKVKANKKSYVKVSTNKNEQERYFDGNLVTILDHTKKEYAQGKPTKLKVDMEEVNQLKKVKNRFSKTPNGENIYVYRPDLSHMTYAKASLFSQELALGYLEDYHNWSIVGETSMFNTPTLVIEGKFNDYYQQKHKAETFKIWVSKETGIVLKLEEYSGHGSVISGMETTKFKLGETIEDNDFKKAKPEKYKEKKIELTNS